MPSNVIKVVINNQIEYELILRDDELSGLLILLDKFGIKTKQLKKGVMPVYPGKYAGDYE